MPTTFDGMMQQAEVLVESGLLPASIKKPETALAVILAGREMGLPPMQSFRALYVVNGQIAMAAEHMAARLLQAGVTYVIEQMTGEVCQIAFRRPNGMQLTYRYTMAQAKAAKLTGKDNWQHYPVDMLYNRCMALGARKIAADVLSGMHTPDELGAVEMVDEGTGQVIDVQIPEEETAAESEEQTAAEGWPSWSAKAHRRFWAAAQEKGLYDGKDAGTLHLAFGVDSMSEYMGSLADAGVVLKIMEYVWESVGYIGLCEALGDRTPAEAVAEGMTYEDMVQAVEDMIEAKVEAEPAQGELT